MSVFDDASRQIEELMRRVEQLESQVRTLRSGTDGPPRTAYRTREVAQMTGMKLSTIQAWIRNGQLQAADMGGYWAVPAAAVESLIAGRSA